MSLMRRLTYLGAGSVSVEQVPVPDVGQGEALVRVLASALCGSERSALLGGMAGNAGHEAAGVVERLQGEAPVGIGDLVGLAAVTGCGDCDRCAVGRETQCRVGVRVGGGWHAEYVVTPISGLRRVDSSDPTLATLQAGDALGVPGRVARRFPPVPGRPVAVIGLGPVGLGHVLVQSRLGAEVIGVEPSAHRREAAVGLGAAAVAASIAELDSPPVIIECTGVPAVIESALALVDSSGLVIQSGECGRPVAVVPSDVMVRREVTYTGSWFYAGEDYPFMSGLVADGLPLRDLCTHEVDPAEAEDAFAEFVQGRTGKVVVRW